MSLTALPALVALALPLRAKGQTVPIELAQHTPFTLETPAHLPMRVGQTVRAELLYPVYAGSVMALPAGTAVIGSVTALRPDRARRVRSRFNLDFTPFHIPVVRFDRILLADGTSLPISTDIATDGAPVVRLAAAGPRKKRNFLHREYDDTVDFVRDKIVFVTAPGRGDRLLQLAYHQLPWHPQRIERNTAWTVETAAALRIPLQPQATPALTVTGASSAISSESYTLQADLDEALSSATAQPGQPIHATIAEPVFRADHSLAIPQGAVLTGTVTQDKPSRRFGRAGSLRFAFSEVVLPSGERHSLTANLAGADAGAQQKLALDSEGNVSPAPQDKLIVPALLLVLAAAPLDPDPGDNDEFFKNADASNSLGLIGFITSVAVNDARVSAGFGFYGAALSISSRFIQHGEEIAFPRDTRIVLQTVGRPGQTVKP